VNKLRTIVNNVVIPNASLAETTKYRLVHTVKLKVFHTARFQILNSSIDAINASLDLFSQMNELNVSAVTDSSEMDLDVNHVPSIV